jgi:hypothetical protein
MYDEIFCTNTAQDMVDFAVVEITISVANYNESFE